MPEHKGFAQRALYMPHIVRSWPIQLTLAALSGILHLSIFPTIEAGLLAWVTFVPLLFAIEACTAKRSFLLGWIAGFIPALGVGNWIYLTVLHYYEKSSIFAFIFLVSIIGCYMGVYVGLFTVTVTTLRRIGTKVPFAILVPSVWVCWEWVRSNLFTGLPWVLVGSSQYRNLPIIQISDITSVYGVTFLIFLVNALLYQGFTSFRTSREEPRRWRKGVAHLLLAVSVLVACLGYGYWRLGQWREIELSQEARPSSETQAVSVCVIQGNVKRELRWKSIYYGRNLAKYLRSTKTVVNEDLDLVIWPENAMNFYIDRDPRYRDALLGFVNRYNLRLITGGPHYIDGDGGERLYFNAAYFITAEGGIEGIYHKIHLLPFSEYRPGIVKRIFPKKGEGPKAFTPGEEFTIHEIDGTPFATLICFEMIYPHFVRKFVDRGARFLVNISNDSWFGRTSAPNQHLSLVVFRAVENRVPVVRATSTGISAFVDPVGRLYEETALFEEATIQREIHCREGSSFYTRHGQIFLYLCVLVVLLALGEGVWGRVSPVTRKAG